MANVRVPTGGSANSSAKIGRTLARDAAVRGKLGNIICIVFPANERKITRAKISTSFPLVCRFPKPRDNA